MKLSSLIKSLQESLFIHGDIDVVMAIDEEGNHYNHVEEIGHYFHDGENLTDDIIVIWPGGHSIEMYLFDESEIEDDQFLL